MLFRSNSTVEPSASALRAAAQAAGREIDLQIICREEAIRALKAGDQATHDRMVLEMAGELKDRDVIVLAQASMAHMEQPVSAHTGLPVLSSPRRCVEQVRRLLEQMP